MGFATKVLQQTALVYDLRSDIAAGVSVFFIVQVDKIKHQSFLSTLNRGSGEIDLNQFGTILHRGIGEPDAQIKAELHEKFGMYAEAA